MSSYFKDADTMKPMIHYREVPIDGYNFEDRSRLVLCVNSEPFRDCPPGTLLMRLSISYLTGGPVCEHGIIEYRESVPGAYRIYPKTDFNTAGLCIKETKE